MEGQGKKVADENELKNFVPFFDGEIATGSYDHLEEDVLSAPWVIYSGTRAVQTLAALKKELNGTWVGDGVGRAAPLTEEGFKSVQKTDEAAHMKAFFRRLLTASGNQIVDEGALNGIVPFYDGKFGQLSFNEAVAKLQNAPWAVPLR